MGTIQQKIALQGARFFAFHGFYEEEQVVGSEFIANVETSLDGFATGHDDISRTVNYEVLYDIVSEEMKSPRKLIESVAYSILERIRLEFISVKYIKVSIQKLNPPLSGEVKHSLVELEFSR
jgi:dihydroneopterin aldolase